MAFLQGEPGDGPSPDPAEPGRLPDAAALMDVMEDRLGLLRRQGGGEECGPLAFGEAGLAGAASEEAPGLVGPVAIDDVEISRTPLAPFGAVGIQAAEDGEVVHDAPPSGHLGVGSWFVAILYGNWEGPAHAMPRDHQVLGASKPF